METCRNCGCSINEGFSWESLCVVCAEPFLEQAQYELAYPEYLAKCFGRLQAALRKGNENGL